MTSARVVGFAPKLAMGAACLVGGLALQGCVEKSAPATSRLPTFAYDLTGAARSCTASAVTPAAGKQVTAAITLANDGGWCDIKVHTDSGAPYTAGLVTVRPKHGKVYVHSVGDDTRIDYTPQVGFAGADSYTVKLLPGDATLEVAATVTPAGAAPAAVKK